MTNQKSEITNQKSFNVEFRRFLWSSILIALSACLGNVVDAIIVGNLIGEDGVSAINLSKPITQFMFTVSMLLSTGAGMLVGWNWVRKITSVPHLSSRSLRRVVWRSDYW